MSSWSEAGLPFQEALSYLLTGDKWEQGTLPSDKNENMENIQREKFPLMY